LLCFLLLLFLLLLFLLLLFLLLLPPQDGGRGEQPRPEKVAEGISTALFITLEGITLSVPVIGTWTQWALFGSEFPGTEIIPRLYIVHVLLIPGILLALIGLHIAAIIFYRLRGKRLVRPMVTGRGEVQSGVQPMRPARWWVAVLCLIIAIGITRWVIAGAPPFSS